jgi:predicted ArsR family transcriptional regulator
MSAVVKTKGSGHAGGSRERIIRLLLKEQRTVDGLASSLEITKNAVRAQLALLEREGLVEVRGEQKSTRRPAAVYGLAAGTDTHFSQAYPAVLSGVVGTLAEMLEPKQVEEILKGAGRRIADSLPPLAGAPRERVEGAVKFLESLGSVAEVVEAEGGLVIKGHGCPISKAVQTDARSCLAIKSLLARLTGLQVREGCDHGARPSCRFELALPAKKAGRAPGVRK